MADNYNGSVNPNANLNNPPLEPPVDAGTPVFGAAASGGMIASLDNLSDDDVVKKQTLDGGSGEKTGQFFVPTNDQTEVLVGANERGSVMPGQPQVAGVAAMEVAAPPEPKKKPILLIALLALLFLGGAGALVWNFFLKPKPTAVVTPPPQAIVLDYWGLWEPSEALDRVLRNFEAENSGVSVHYMKQSISGYRETLQQAIQGGTGPDVFRYHATWVPQLRDLLAAVPASVQTVQDFTMNYYPVMANQLIDKTADSERIVGMPLMYDGMALLYNKEALTAKNIEVPRTWGDFQLAATNLTEIDETNGQIIFSGAAMGLADNIDNFSDVLALLILQNGGNLDELASNEVMDALSFYTSFYNPVGRNVRVWDESFDSSTLAFARGEVAMIFAPSWTIHDILAINPTLDIGVAPVPQLNETSPISVASYWVEGVSATSTRQDAAWRLLAYLSRPDVLETLYTEQTQLRYFGEMYPRPDMADLLANDAYVQPYLSQAPFAIGHYFTDKTYDVGLDDELIRSMATAVNEVNEETDISRVVDRLQNSALGLREQYGAITPEPAP